MNTFQLIENDLKLNSTGPKTQYIFDPYNRVNKYISKEEVESILQKYGVTQPIRNLQLYQRAFVHSSYVRKPNAMNLQYNIVVAPQPPDCVRLFTKSNERLEFLGDGILEAVVKFLMYQRFPKATEGFMTDKKIAIVKNENIGKLAMEIGLSPWFIISQYAESKFTRTQVEKLGCLFEAFVGAIYLDFSIENNEDEINENVFHIHSGKGFQQAQIFLQHVLERHIDWVNLIARDDNFKNILQVIIQKEFKVTPHYMDVIPNPSAFHMGVYLCLGQPVHETAGQKSIPLSEFKGFHEIHDYMARHGKCFIFLGEGRHSKKKKAEQIACESALEILYPFVMYAVVQKELGTVPLVRESVKDHCHKVEILLPHNNSKKETLQIVAFTTFSEIREKKSEFSILIGEGAHQDKTVARQTAFQNAFQALKAFDV